MRRTYRGVDGNQKALVKELRSVPGVSVWIINTEMDIVVGYRGQNFIFEIKDPDKPPSGRKLTDNEIKFLETWTGQADVVFTAEDVLASLTTEEKS